MTVCDSPGRSMLRPPTPRVGCASAGSPPVPMLNLSKINTTAVPKEPSHPTSPNRAAGSSIPRSGTTTPRATSRPPAPAMTSTTARASSTSRSSSPSPYRPAAGGSSTPRGSTTPRARSISTPRSVSTPRGSSAQISTPRGAITPRGSTTPRGSSTQVLPDGFKFEMDRLQNELTTATRQLQKREQEVKTLQTKVRDSEGALGKKVRECEKQQARTLEAEQKHAAMSKEHHILKTENMKLESKFNNSERQLDKLTSKVANMPSGPNIDIITKDLQSQIKALQDENKALESKVKARDNVVRAKDKELEQMGLKVAETEKLQMDLGASVNRSLYLEKQLEDLKEDVKTVLNMHRQKEQDFNQAQGQCSKLEQALGESRAECSDVKSELEIANNNIGSLEGELKVTLDKLHRAESVASRVARFEHDDGLHGDGTVPFQFFLNETSYLKGEVRRLREKLISRGLAYDETECASHAYWATEDEEYLNSSNTDMSCTQEEICLA